MPAHFIGGRVENASLLEIEHGLVMSVRGMTVWHFEAVPSQMTHTCSILQNCIRIVIECMWGQRLSHCPLVSISLR